MKSLKVFFVTVILLAAQQFHVFCLDIPADSRIASVTVYPDSALLTRTASLKLEPGIHRIIFTGILPDIDENSLRVSAQGSASAKLFGAQLQKKFLEQLSSQRAQEITSEIEKINDEIKSLNDNKSTLSDQKNFLDSLRLFSRSQLPEELVTKMPEVEALDKIYIFLGQKLRANYLEVLETNIKIRQLDRKIDALQKELAQIYGPLKKSEHSIVVNLEVLKPGSIVLSISYLVKGASWRPVYDARAFIEKSMVEFVMYANVLQTTGEDWNNCDIYLSTAKPDLSARMPYVAPWFLKPIMPVRFSKASSPRGVQALQYAAFDAERVGGAEFKEESLTEPAASVEKAQMVYSESIQKGVAVIYKIPQKSTVKSDGSENKLPVSTQDLTAKFAYSTYPRSTPFAYLGSRVTNAKDLQLLAGRVNVFLEGDFSGVSSIDNIGPGEEFDLYLGVDENIKVKREEIEKKVDDVLIANIPSSTRKTTYKYKITLENYKNQKIKVNLFEAMPTSQDERIKVKVVDVKPLPTEKDWKDRKGVWFWDLELVPKAKQEVTYNFIIEHPRDLPVEGL